jgi:hypothetical protein
MKIGIVTGREIKTNRDAEGNSRLLQAEISSADDKQTIELVSACGEQYNPRDGDVLFIAELGPNWKIAIASSDETEPDDTLEQGERKIYSLKGDGEVMACVRFKADGTLILNEGEDWAVRFSALESAFNELQGKWNSFAAAYAPGGPASVGTPPAAIPPDTFESSADITEARIDNIQVP